MRFPALFVASSVVSLLALSACSTAEDEPTSHSSSANNADSSTTTGDDDTQTTMDGGTSDDGGPIVTEINPWADVKTTVDRTYLTAHFRQDASKGPNPSKTPEALAYYLDLGYGAVTEQPGEGFHTRVIDNTTAPAPGPNAKRITRFVHIPDFQISDDESPARVCNLDAVGFTEAAARPQEGYLCRMANSAVHTINALSEKDPVEFVLLGGDNADNAQANENEWIMNILSGGVKVKCDSGNADDPVTGPDNDGKDEFFASGLKMPWKWVTGNHDVLVQGNADITSSQFGIDLMPGVLGTNAPQGTRNYAKPGAPVEVGNFVVADLRRGLVSRKALMDRIATHADGHGIGDAQRASGKAIYAFDVPNTPIRFVVLDTAAETGAAEGVIHFADLVYIKPLLDQALADKKWVVLASHHAADKLTDGGGAFGVKQADAVLPEAWKNYIGTYPNVILSMVGHSHRHQALAINPPNGGHSYWELMTSSIADFPHQFRTVEIMDQDNGWIMVRGTAVDLAHDAVSKEGYARGVADFVSGYGQGDGLGEAIDRNVELWIRKPVL